MARRALVALIDEAIAIVGHVVFGVSLASVPDFDMRAVWVRRPEVSHVYAVTTTARVVLDRIRGTAWRGLREPMPA